MNEKYNQGVSGRPAIAADGPDVPIDAAQIGASAEDSGPGSFDFLLGRWNVTHRRLKDRLAGASDWIIFSGTCEASPLLGGAGNVDDNFLDLPGEPYRAVSLRKFNATTGDWSIWWLDSRSDTIDPPVRGRFEDGVGLFVGDDIFNGRPIQVRFRWTGTSTDVPRWEQAFSADRGSSWEVNWTMDFHRSP